MMDEEEWAVHDFICQGQKPDGSITIELDI